MQSGFVTVPNTRHYRSRRSRKKRPTSTSESLYSSSSSNANTAEHKVETSTSIDNTSHDKIPTPIKRIWANAVSTPVNQSNAVQSIVLIQAEQQFETHQQHKKLRYESTTNRTFLLSLTLSKLNSDPSLIICASYICRLCQTFNVFMPSTLIILCHQYYQFRRFPTYLRVIHSKCQHVNCAFINPCDACDEPFTVKGIRSLPSRVLDSCVATNIHLKYPNLIQLIDQDQKFSNWSHIHAMFQCHHNEYHWPSIVQTNIILFDPHNAANAVDDESVTLDSIALNNSNVSASLHYDMKCGLLIQISNDIEADCNKFYQLVYDTEEYIWKELNNAYGISTKALMSILTENVFWCSRDIVCLYNFENESWRKLQGMGCSWSDDAKQLYFDATGQKMFCMGIKDSFTKEYAYDETLDKWIECNTCVSFNYYDVVKDNWYRHPSILSNYNGNIDSAMWIEENDPNIMYCAVTSCEVDEETNGDRKYYRCRVEYYDNRSEYKQWLYHPEKTWRIQSVLEPGLGHTFQIDLVL